jgi:hypothetical protein
MLKSTAKDLGERRNALAHTAIGLSGTSLVRSMGFLEPMLTVNRADDSQLTTDIGSFHVSLGRFINELDRELPFRDHNRVIFSEPAKVVI